jgi:hypothetical protein
MATSPCGIDTGVVDIQATQDELTNLLGPGSKDALASINAKATELGNKLADLTPTIEENPNLQKKLQSLAGKDPLTALNEMADIQNEFGPLVSDLQDILAEVSPDLQSISSDISDLFGGETGSVSTLQASLSGADFSNLLSKASNITSIDTASICAKCKNLEVKTAPDGSKKAVELPSPPAIPQIQSEPEPYKPPQTLVAKNDLSEALLIFQDSQNWARDKLLNEFKERGFPPTISELEHKKNGNRYFSHYTFIYMKYASIVGLDPDPTLWIRRVDPWVELKYARDTNYIGEPAIPNEDYIYDEEYAYFQNANTTTRTYEEIVQYLYDITPEEAKKVFDGTTANKFLKEI